MASSKEVQSSAPVKRAPPPALNPESCALTQPWKDFLSRGFITELTVQWKPMGVTVFCRVNPSLQREGEGSVDIPVGDAKARIISAGLWTPKGSEKGKDKVKKDDLLPLKSLTIKDFEEKDKEKFTARVLAVAKALGDTTARGRIGSLKMMIEGVDTFEDWWDEASPAQKARLLSDAKHYKEFGRGEMSAIADSLPACPFRGSVPTPTPEEDSKEEPVPPPKAEGHGSPKGKNGA